MIVENSNSVLLAGQAWVITEDRELAWAEHHVVTNPALKWPWSSIDMSGDIGRYSAMTIRICGCGVEFDDALRYDGTVRGPGHPRTNCTMPCKKRLQEAKYQSARRQNLRRYGLTPEDYDAHLEAQDGACALCGTREVDYRKNGTPLRLAVDHNHDTGRFRGLLCARCNTGIGRFHDDPALLRAAARYLEDHR